MRRVTQTLWTIISLRNFQFTKYQTRIMKYLNRYFNRFFQLMCSVGNESVAEYYAIALMSMLLFCNFIFLISISYALLDLKIDLGFDNKIIIVIYFFCTLICFYFLFVAKNKFVKIIDDFKNESSKQRKVGNLLTLGYIIVSVGLLIFGFYLMILKNKGAI